LIAALSVLFLAAVTCTGISVYVGWQLTHPAKKPLDESPEDYDLAYENIQFYSREDQVELSGWFLPARSPSLQTTIIFSHGYRGNRLEEKLPALSLAKSLTEAGYNIVMFDFRNSGESGGNLTSVGLYETWDLLGAVDWVKQRHPGKIGVIGFSMGAVTAILAAAEEPDIAAVVADSPFSRLGPYLRENLPVWSHLPDFPFTPLIMAIMQPITGIDVDQVDAVAAVNKVYPRPILFIHSRDDDAIPYGDSELLWSQHTDRFELWLSSGAGHVYTYRLYPEEYTERVMRFFAAQLDIPS